ncbi:MAG TPA: hypothetical protein PLK12_16495, partial [Prolixibacteraceae bacterium]|nr:hypothetical protein [Prolixibacteraceae bacterium]
ESQITDLDHFTNADETDPLYAADSAYIKTGIRNWDNSLAKKIEASDTTRWGTDDDPTNELQALRISNDTVYLENGGFVVLPAETDPVFGASVAHSILSADTANWNNKTYIADTDGDTRIDAEKNPNDNTIRFGIEGSETLTLNGASGTNLVLPTNDNTSSFTVTKNNGSTVFMVDGSGRMTGDGSGLSNVKPVINYAQGNQSVYFHEGMIPGLNLYEAQKMREVTISCPGPGVILAMASGYCDWESKDEDLVRIWFYPHPTVSPTSSWETPDFHNLRILSDYQCADSSDQYTSWAHHKIYTVSSAQNYTVSICADKPFTSSKVLIGDVVLNLIFFPTGGTGGGLGSSGLTFATSETQENERIVNPNDISQGTPYTSPPSNEEEPVKDILKRQQAEIDSLKNILTRLITERRE